MTCTRCHRPLLTPYLSIHAGNRAFPYGPKCARLSGLSIPRPSATAKPTKRRAKKAADEDQLSLEFAEA